MTSQVEVPPLTGLIHFISGKRRVNSDGSQAHLSLCPVKCPISHFVGQILFIIMKTGLFKYIENFTKTENSQIKILIFFIFLLKT